MQACLLYDQDELARSREMLHEIEAAAIARGDEHTRLWVVLQWPRLEWYTGQWSSGSGIRRKLWTSPSRPKNRSPSA